MPQPERAHPAEDILRRLDNQLRHEQIADEAERHADGDQQRKTRPPPSDR